MAGKPIPDDRQMTAIIERLKVYNTYKARQLQASSDAARDMEDALKTVETWAVDSADDGKAWAQARELQANEKIAEGQQWRDRLRREEQQAANDAEFRSRLDMRAVKDELRKHIDDYQSTVRQQAEDGQPWARQMLAQANREGNEAKRILDDGTLDRAMDMTSTKSAEQLRKHKLIADRMIERETQGKNWLAEYQGKPGAWPGGQRTDVAAALDGIHDWAAARITDLQPFGVAAANHVDALRRVQSWTGTLKSQVAATATTAPAGPATAAGAGSANPAVRSAKASGAAGAADARLTMARLEAFETQLERDSNEDLETYRRWTDRNNKVAAEWIKSSSPKHRQWAEEWMKMQKQA